MASHFHLTVQTDIATLRLTFNSDTGKVESIEPAALSGEVTPFCVKTDTGTFIALAGGRDRTFTMTLSVAENSD